MSGRQSKRTQIEDSDIMGLRYFGQLAPLLERPYDDRCERDRVRNRELHYDQFCVLVQLNLFNPIVTSPQGVL